MSAKRTTERERFEAWARSVGLDPSRNWKHPQYDHGLVEWAWLAWRAAKRQQARARVGKGER